MGKSVALLLLLGLNFGVAQAAVDMRNANFTDTWTDIVVPGSGYDLRVRRTYNSRSLYNGIFGFGWCSDFETRLQVNPESTITVIECGGGLRITFYPRGMEGKGSKATVDKIIAGLKKRNPKISAKRIKRLRKKLAFDFYLREEFARRLKLKGSVRAGVTYYAEGRQNESLVQKGNMYVRRLADGTYQRFTIKGRLLSLFDRNGNTVKLSYKGARLVRVADNNGRKLTFRYSSGGKVRSISGPNGLSASYAHTREDLRRVTNMWSNSYKYEYDDLHNLTKVSYPDRTFKALRYNKDKDWVTQFTHRDGCIESYRYEENRKDPLNHYWSIVKKSCKKKVVNNSRFEFFHRVNKAGQRYLHRSITVNNGDRSEITYHPIFGKPTQTLRSQVRIRYAYYKNGLLKQKTEPNRTLAYKYKNKCQKVSQVRTNYYRLVRNVASKKKRKAKAAPKRQLVRKVRTDFFYDKNKCNLVRAKNTEGQTVRLTYDIRGRIQTITDQAKKLVQISYEERFGKPNRVTRPGLGAIEVKYKSNGEIEKVESKEGPQVATQVASIFNNLIEIISPATQELSL